MARYMMRFAVLAFFAVITGECSVPTLTIRRLDTIDRDWLKQASQSEGISMEEYVRRMVRTKRIAATQAFGDVLDGMNASLDEETRAVLGDPPPIDCLSPHARDIAPGPDGDDALMRAAS